jgi:hypothetical protein
MNKNNITYVANNGKEVTTIRKYTEFPYRLSDTSIVDNRDGSQDKWLTIINPFSGQSYKLSAVEEAVYSVIMGAQMVPGYMTNSKLQKDVRKGLDWFRENNAEAYMVLLD